jgi:A/G-specific adenine glycosylase
MQGSFPLPLGKINAGEKEYRQSIDYQKTVDKLKEHGVELPETKLDSFLGSIETHMSWLRRNGDRFPWRYTTDPWKVFVAEVLLQQSTGDQVGSMYIKFLKRYDSPYKMQKSSDEEVERHLKSIGLNKKKRETLQRAADVFVTEYGGVPDSEEKLREIRGVGQYISRATILFAYGRSKALSDTNIEGFVETEFNIKVNQKQTLSIMDELTPNDAGLARALYFWIIDKER